MSRYDDLETRFDGPVPDDDRLRAQAGSEGAFHRLGHRWVVDALGRLLKRSLTRPPRGPHDIHMRNQLHKKLR